MVRPAGRVPRAHVPLTSVSRAARASGQSGQDAARQGGSGPPACSAWRAQRYLPTSVTRMEVCLTPRAWCGTDVKAVPKMAGNVTKQQLPARDSDDD
jgi:hypothetical protein